MRLAFIKSKNTSEQEEIRREREIMKKILADIDRRRGK